MELISTLPCLSSICVSLRNLRMNTLPLSHSVPARDFAEGPGEEFPHLVGVLRVGHLVQVVLEVVNRAAVVFSLYE